MKHCSRKDEVIITQIAERYIRTPYKKYSVTVKSNVMRKLTIMEWTLLHIVSDFSNRPKFANYRLEYFFETVLGINKSELLIRPCLESLIQNKIIVVDDYTQFTVVAKIFIKNIHLTKYGVETVKRGYVPGADKESSEVLYYDLLREKVYDVLVDLGPHEESVKITDEAEFPVKFPAEAILVGLQKGILLPDKYRNNSTEAEEVSCNTEDTEWRTDLLTVDLSDAQQLTCNLPATQEVRKLLFLMLGEQFEPATAWPVLAQPDALPETFAIGEEVLSEIELWIRLEDYAFFDNRVFGKLSKRFVSTLSGKTVVIFSCDEFCVKAGKWTEIRVPFSGPAKHSLIMDDSGDYLCAAVLPVMLKDEKLNIWLAYQAEDTIDLRNWFATQLDQAVTLDPSMAVLYKLPFVDSGEERCESIVCQRLAQLNSSIRRVAFLKEVNERCMAISVSPVDAVKVIPALTTYHSGNTVDERREDIVTFYTEFFKAYKPEIYEDFVITAVSNAMPNNMNDLLFLLSAVMYCEAVNVEQFIRKADEVFRDQISPYMINLMFAKILTKDSMYPLTKLLSCAVAYNDIRQSVHQIETLLPNMDFTVGNDQDVIAGDLIECKDLSAVNEQIEIIAAAIELASGWGVSVFNEKGPLCVVSKNVRLLTRLLNMFIPSQDGIADLYLIDTCVFLHTPDILKYFTDSEILRIPFTVLRELDYHKDNNADSTLKKSAAFACKQIEKYLDKAAADELPRFAVEPQDYPELLPPGFSDRKHDDLILSAAFRYKLLNPIVLTDDTNFRNIARSQGIRIKAWKAFIAERGGVAKQTSDTTTDGGQKAAGQKETLEETTPTEPGSVTKAQFLGQSVDFLKQPPFNLSTKKVKSLSAAGFQTLQELYGATTADINQKCKAASSRVTARQVIDKLRAKVDAEFLDC